MAEELNKIFDAMFIANALPARQWLPWEYVIPIIKQVSDVFAKFREQNRSYFNEHIQSLNPDHVRDVLDALVVQRNAMQAEGEMVSFTDQHAAAIIMDIVLRKAKS
jgi:hypothetical protein